MTLLLSRDDVKELMSPEQAMEVLSAVACEEADGTVVHMPPFGGSSGTGIQMRVVGGGLRGMGRMGLRAGLGQTVSLLFDAESRGLLAIAPSPYGTLRVGATMALAARYLARPDARVVGILGSGMNALSILECLNIVRPIERVEVFSPTPAHREKLASEAGEALDVPVTAHDSAEAVIEAAEILVVATSSDAPVLRYDQLRPGMHVTSMGRSTELDESVYLQADQLVAGSRDQEIQEAGPSAHMAAHGRTGQLWGLLDSGRFTRERIVQLGSIIKGDVAPRNGAGDINVFRESRGGVGDVALASYVYEQARARGLGTEFQFS